MDTWEAMEQRGLEQLHQQMSSGNRDRERLITALELVASGKRRTTAHLSLEGLRDPELEAMVMAVLSDGLHGGR